MADRAGWVWPLAAAVLCGICGEIVFGTVCQAKRRELESLEAQQSALIVKIREARVVRGALDRFHAQVRAQDAGLAELDKMAPHLSDLREEVEERWLRSAFEEAGYRVVRLRVGPFMENDFTVSRQTRVTIRSEAFRNLQALLTLLRRRTPVHRIGGITETRHSSGFPTYEILIEVHALKERQEPQHSAG